MMDSRSPARRRRFLLIGIVLATLFMIGRAAQLQLVQSENWRARATDQHATQSVVPAARGTIYDRDGVPLAASSEAFRINIAPREVKDGAALSRKLESLTGLDRAVVRRSLNRERRWVVLPGDYPSGVREALEGTQGVYFDRVLKRFYPHGEIAREILGSVNAAGNAMGNSTRCSRARRAWRRCGATRVAARFRAPCFRPCSRCKAATSISRSITICRRLQPKHCAPRSRAPVHAAAR
jgi:cell division protein FtsI/penicillin-binding protein 2